MPLNVSVQHGKASLPLMPGEQEGSSWGDTSVSLALVNSCQDWMLLGSPLTLCYVHPTGVVL